MKVWPAVSAVTLGVAAILIGCGGGSGGGDNVSPTAAKASIGRALFHEPLLSIPAGESCATCHADANGFSDPRRSKPTSEGAVKGLFTSRQAPALPYLLFSPGLHLDSGTNEYVGGQFWDGHAADFATQVHFPILSPNEMNNADKASFVGKVASLPEGAMMKQVYGANVFANVDQAFADFAEVISVYENSIEFRRFSSKYDKFLAGAATLTAFESNGLTLFNGKAQCFKCHPSAAGPAGQPPVFTNFTYANLGVPKNPNNPFYTQPNAINPDGAAFVDQGLGAVTTRPQDAGKMKAPSLRNVGLSAPYFHNGAFGTLKDALRFLNARDVGSFDPPEVAANVDHTNTGNLGLTDSELDDLEAFLKTLTDQP